MTLRLASYPILVPHRPLFALSPLPEHRQTFAQQAGGRAGWLTGGQQGSRRASNAWARGLTLVLSRVTAAWGTLTSEIGTYQQTGEIRAKVLQTPGSKGSESKPLLSTRACAKSTTQAVSKPTALNIQESRSRTAFAEQRSLPDMNTIARTDSVSDGRIVQSERFSDDGEKRPKQDKTAFISAVSKIKTKQMKGMITGMGKELRRAANTVGEKIPGNLTKKKSKGERERQELLEIEPARPQARTPAEIKKEFGRQDDARQAVSITHSKLVERGEKLSALNKRTGELEADAANFSSLAQELSKKHENKKWYEL